MAISRNRKEELISEYVDLLKQSRAVFLTQYSGLSVKEMQDLRASVRKAEGAFIVTKNTLMLRALEQAGLPSPSEKLVGQLATGFALNEVPSLAKALTDYMKEDELLSIKFGILGDKLLSAEEIEELAKLPSLDELRGQILGLIQAPARNMAMVLASGVRQVVNVMDAYARSEGSGDLTEEAA